VAIGSQESCKLVACEENCHWHERLRPKIKEIIFNAKIVQKFLCKNFYKRLKYSYRAKCYKIILHEDFIMIILCIKIKEIKVVSLYNAERKIRKKKT